MFKKNFRAQSEIAISVFQTTLNNLIKINSEAEVALEKLECEITELEIVVKQNENIIGKIKNILN
jgi:hypothetical protein